MKFTAETVPAYRVKRGDRLGEMVKDNNGERKFVCNATILKNIAKDGGIVLETDAGWNAESSRNEKFTVWRIKP